MRPPTSGCGILGEASSFGTSMSLFCDSTEHHRQDNSHRTQMNFLVFCWWTSLAQAPGTCVRSFYSVSHGRRQKGKERSKIVSLYQKRAFLEALWSDPSLSIRHARDLD